MYKVRKHLFSGYYSIKVINITPYNYVIIEVTMEKHVEGKKVSGRVSAEFAKEYNEYMKFLRDTYPADVLARIKITNKEG